MAQAYLADAGYWVGSFPTSREDIFTFENDTIFGFVIYYREPKALIKYWHEDSTSVLNTTQFLLRRSEMKAWNVYFVFLAEQAADYGESIAMGAIEENLVGTRKIARAGVAAPEALRSALLPLLPIQNAPQIAAVDMVEEVRLRTQELPSDLIETFLSGASDATLVQILEAST
jgi:hypothetical protein